MNIVQEQKFNIRLVKTVKKYPLLYNTELKDYRKRNCRDRAWIDVAEELNCDPNYLKKKWKNFRSILLRNLKRIQMGESIQQYYLYDHIKFIIPYLKKTYESGALKRTREAIDTKFGTDSDHSIEDIELVEDISDNSHDPIYLENYENYEPFEADALKKSKLVSSEDDAGTDVEDELVYTPRRSEHTEKVLVNDKGSNSTTIQVAATPTRYIEQHGEKVSTESPKRLFLLSLLPDLNEMTNSQMRQFKCKVVQIIDQILNENNS